MSKYKFGACEYNFPMWGSLALEMAHDAGFDGIEITDGGGYLQPHPMNKGYFVEVERLQPNLIRMDNYPLLDKMVQDDYLNAKAKTGIEITGVHLYFLNCQGFVSASNESLTGKDALMTIKNAIIAASQMGIPMVSVPTRGMFGVAKNLYALQKLEYAVQAADEYGIRISNSFDTTLARELEVIDKLDGKLKADFHTMDPAFNAKEPAPEMIRSLGKDRIEQFKMKDVIADKEGFLVKEAVGDALFGQGHSDWKECVAAIKEIGYEGWIISDTPYNSLQLNVNGEDYVSLGMKDLATLKNAFCE
ncbi:MAG: sugar phosphate isomerase/epimerase [Firmicutes bacterium]|nr:sugar phosphate isomerase/epimerase [Bacillota bacterium]